MVGHCMMNCNVLRETNPSMCGRRFKTNLSSCLVKWNWSHPHKEGNAYTKSNNSLWHTPNTPTHTHTNQGPRKGKSLPCRSEGKNLQGSSRSSKALRKWREYVWSGHPGKSFRHFIKIFSRKEPGKTLNLWSFWRCVPWTAIKSLMRTTSGIVLWCSVSHTGGDLPPVFPVTPCSRSCKFSFS